MYVHSPVLKSEILDMMSPVVEKGPIVDATLGEGGYSEAFFASFPQVTVAGVERDPDILEVARRRLSSYGGRMHFFHMWFDDFFRDYHSLMDRRPEAVVFDLGISRFHFESSGRGFSFSRDEALDMRLDPSSGISAAVIVNTASESELADIIYLYGEERYSRRIARVIVEERRRAPIESALRLANIIAGAIPGAGRRKNRIHPATRSFQALRIKVNRELERLSEALDGAFEVLLPGGRMAVVSYHSLEDRIVKDFFRQKNRNKPSRCWVM